MNAGRALRNVALALAVSIAVVSLGACTATVPKVVKHSAVTVAVSDPFFSLNAATSFGATTTNQEVAYATSSQFVYYDNTGDLHEDASFGTVRQVAGTPLNVKYAIKPGVTWSDGVSVSTADLLLAWAANSGALDTTGFDGRKYVSAKGVLAPLPKGIVWFGARSTAGLQHAQTLPTLGTDHRSMTLRYSSYYVDWRSALEVGLPAHIVAEKAFGLTSPKAADAALISAISTGDATRLAELAKVWNSGFNVRHETIDASLLVTDGPYKIGALAPDGSVTMTANKRYTGAHHPRVETITTKVVASAKKQVAALDSGTVDVITPAATAQTAKSLINLKKITVASGYDASFEHLDLQFSHSKNGTFDSKLVRQAFLKAVPRSTIVNKIAGSVQEETASRASFMLFPGTAAYQSAIADNGSRAFASVDVAGAKALLAKAKVRHPVVCILFDPANPIREAEFSYIQASEKLAGFTVTNCSSTKWLAKLGKPGAYDASIFGWRSTSSAVTSATPRVHSGVLGENYNFYASPVTDKLLETLAQTSDSAQQTALLTEIDRQLFADGYGLPLFQLPSLTAFRTTVTGIQRSPFVPGIFWNVWEWRPQG